MKDEIRPGMYWWVRDKDETGMSGCGAVAQVAVFVDGSACLRWMKSSNAAKVSSTVFYDSVDDLIFVHGHGERRTGRLVDFIQPGDLVFVSSMEGFGGLAEVIEVRHDLACWVQWADKKCPGNTQAPLWCWPHEIRKRKP